MGKVIKISKTKNKVKSRVGILSFILLVSIICFFLMSPVFNIEAVTVTGNSQVSNEEIISASGINYGKNILSIDKFSVLNNIESISYVKDANIKRCWPNGINILIKEKTPIAEVDFYKSKILIDDEGYVLDIIKDDLSTGLILISNLTIVSIKTGEMLKCEESEKLECYLEVLKILRNNDMLNSVVKIENNDNILIYLKEGHIANFGEKNNLQYKVLVLKEIIPKEANAAYIDLSNPSMKVTRPVWGMIEENATSIVRGDENEE